MTAPAEQEAHPAAAIRLLTSHAATAGATALTTPFLLHATYTATSSTAWLALVGAVRMAPSLILGSAAGRLADRCNPQRLLQASAAIRAVLLAGAAWATAAHEPVTWVVAAIILVAIATTPAYAAVGATLPCLHSGRALTRATAVATAIEAGAWAAGPALGGFLLATGPAWHAPALAAGLALLGALLLHQLHLPAHPQPGSPGATTPLRHYLRHSPGACHALIAVAVTNLALGASSSLLLLISDAASSYGQLTAALGVGAVASLALSGAVRCGTHPGLASAAAVGGPLLALGIVPADSRPLLLVVTGAAGVWVEMLATTALRDSVPQRLHGTAYGLLDQVVVGGAALGGALGPLLAGPLGGLGAFAAVGLLALVSGALSPTARPSTTSMSPDSAFTARSGSSPRPASPAGSPSGSAHPAQTAHRAPALHS